MSIAEIETRKMTEDDAPRILRSFYEAHDPELMRRAYGWDDVEEAAAALQDGEEAWAFYCDGQLIGWGSSQRNPVGVEESEVLMVAGVFPEHERKGHRVRILDWMCSWAKAQGYRWASTHTSRANEVQYERKLKESVLGVWVHSGEVWHPEPGHGIFLRDLR